MGNTYGTRDSADHFTANTDLVLIKAQIATLHARAKTMMDACVHHFVPAEDALSGLKQTLVNRVYNAGDVDRKEEIGEFAVACVKCEMTKIFHISARCPNCLSVVKGHQGNSEKLSVYFGDQDFVYFGLWEIGCPKCNFKAVGQVWDQ